MKKLIPISILSILIIGMILLSGCSQLSTIISPQPDPIVGVWKFQNMPIIDLQIVFFDNHSYERYLYSDENGESNSIGTWQKVGDFVYLVNTSHGNSSEWAYNPDDDNIFMTSVPDAKLFRYNGTDVPVIHHDWQPKPILDPIIGVWENDLAVGTYLDIFSENNSYFFKTYRGTTDRGTWVKINDTFYNVTYSGNSRPELFIYNPESDTISYSYSPSRVIFRQGKSPFPPEIGSSRTSSGSGVKVRIDYNGAWSGSYGTIGVTQSVDGFGIKEYTISNPEDVVSAVFQKKDGGASELKVEISENGNVLQSGSTTAAYGVVSVSATV